MKYLFGILLFLPLLFGCEPVELNDSNDNLYWMFEVTINGVTHKAEGYGSQGSGARCYFGDETYFSLNISDTSSSSYISGDIGDNNLTIVNMALGVNPICYFNSDWFRSALLDSEANIENGYSFTYGGPQDIDGLLIPTLPITITDLGWSGGSANIEGQTCKGEYSGVIYLPWDSEVLQYIIPIEIDIKFEAIRI